MVRSIWRTTLVTAFACAGLTWAQQPAPHNPTTSSAPATEQFVTVREAGKPAQRCKVISSWKTADGAAAYKVKVLDTGEMITIVENNPGATIPTSQSGRQAQAKAMRIFHWGKNSTAPQGVPVAPSDTVQNAAPVIRTQDARTTASSTSTNDSSRRRIIVQTTAGSTVPAEPSDWRKSWGKLSDPKPADSRSTATVRDISLPHADAKRPDPLRMPEDYRTRLTDIVPTAKKQEATKADDDKTKAKSTSTTTSSVPTRQPVQSASVGSNNTMRPRHSPDDPPYSWRNTPPAPAPLPRVQTSQVPLGRLSAQPVGNAATSESAANNGRSIGVPVVTIPQTRETKKIEPEKPKPTPLPVVRLETRETEKIEPEKPKPTPLPVVRLETRMPSAPAPRASVTVAQTPPTMEQTPANAFARIPTREETARSTNAFAATPQPYTNGSMMMQGAYAPQMQYAYPNGYSYSNPMGQATMAVPPVAQVSYQTPVSPMCAGSLTQPEMQHWLNVMRDSLYPSQREWAAEALSVVDWHCKPKVVEAMVAGAREDPAATVRAACVRCLTKMKASTPEVLSVVTALKSDSDPRVRQEVDQAMLTLGTARPFTGSSVQPAGAFLPARSQ
jgi:hypothetical protein